MTKFFQCLEFTSEAGSVVNTACGTTVTRPCLPMANFCFFTCNLFPRNFVDRRELCVCADRWLTHATLNRVFACMPEELTLLWYSATDGHSKVGWKILWPTVLLILVNIAPFSKNSENECMIINILYKKMNAKPSYSRLAIESQKMLKITISMYWPYHAEFIENAQNHFVFYFAAFNRIVIKTKYNIRIHPEIHLHFQ